MLAAIVRHVGDAERGASVEGKRPGDDPVTRIPLPETTREAERLLEGYLVAGWELLRVGDFAGELLRLAGERAIERRHL